MKKIRRARGNKGNSNNRKMRRLIIWMRKMVMKWKKREMIEKIIKDKKSLRKMGNK